MEMGERLATEVK